MNKRGGPYPCGTARRNLVTQLNLPSPKGEEGAGEVDPVAAEPTGPESDPRAPEGLPRNRNLREPLAADPRECREALHDGETAEELLHPRGGLRLRVGSEEPKPSSHRDPLEEGLGGQNSCAHGASKRSPDPEMGSHVTPLECLVN